MTRQLAKLRNTYQRFPRTHIFDVDDKDDSAVMICSKKVYLNYEYVLVEKEYGYHIPRYCNKCWKMEKNKK